MGAWLGDVVGVCCVFQPAAICLVKLDRFIPFNHALFITGKATGITGLLGLQG